MCTFVEKLFFSYISHQYFLQSPDKKAENLRRVVTGESDEDEDIDLFNTSKDASNEADKLAVKAGLATGLISSEAATEEERIAAETARIEQQELAKRKQLVQRIV